MSYKQNQSFLILLIIIGLAFVAPRFFLTIIGIMGMFIIIPILLSLFFLVRFGLKMRRQLKSASKQFNSFNTSNSNKQNQQDTSSKNNSHKVYDVNDYEVIKEDKKSDT
jgi:hypothetical protein